MIATKRADGQKRFTVRVTFAVGRDELADTIEWAMRCNMSAPTSRMELFRLVRQRFHEDGCYAIHGTRHEAFELADRLAPECKPTYGAKP